MLWDNRPYHSFDYEMKKRYGQKVYRLSLQGGMTCPNRDGTLGNGGCIFCSEGGSGDFAASSALSVPLQIEQQKSLIRSKRDIRLFIAYFQSFTNTYAPLPYLEKIYTEAVSAPDIAALSVATRPDCLGNDVIGLLSNINRTTPVWVELGLQTIHERTAEFIRRGYALSCFDDAVKRLRNAGIEVIVHTIFGLPGESNEDMLETIRYLARTDIQGIKISLLHILKNTDLADIYTVSPFRVLSQKEYILLLIEALELLPPETVIHRLTGDGPRSLLIEPSWSLNKQGVLNELHHTMKEMDAWQGKKYIPSTALSSSGCF